jgi:SAM-dependent methyltransferase
VRDHTRERLDDLTAAHPASLRDLARLNRWLGNTRGVVRAARRAVGPGRGPLRVVDLACGAGDVGAAVVRALRRDGYDATLHGVDGNAHTIAHARALTPDPWATFDVADVMAPGAEWPDSDVLVASQFLYHFDDDALVEALRRNLPRVRRAFVWSEVVRSPLAARWFGWVAPWLGVSADAVADGSLAVRRGFSTSELRDLARRATDRPTRLTRPAPFRRIVVVTGSGG